MKVGLRTRLFVMTVALLALLGGLGTWWTTVRMRAVLTEDVQWLLLSHGQSLAAMLDGDADVSAFANVVAQASEARVTVIAEDGLVLVDSEVADVSMMDNHAARTEVRAALSPEGIGISSRFSHTLGQQMLYVAVPWRQGSQVGVIRLARPLDRVETEVGRLPKAVAIAGVFGLLLSALLAWVFSEFATRDLRKLVRRARTLAGQPSDSGGDEVRRLTGSVDRISSALQEALDQVAEERTQLQALLSGMREAVVSLDSEGRVKNTNPAAEALFDVGVSAVGQPFEAVMRQPKLVAAVDDARMHGRVGLVELSLPALGAVARELVATIAPLADGGAGLVMRDQT
ncbi:MAG: hypothetical protein GWP91_23030, partial [Rhodobacterales bacterium]|nr:hypothetical protein [Rhodobacterales bacterium]